MLLFDALSLTHPHMCRNYIIIAMTDSMKEIIRVLQLTSPTQEEGALACTTGSVQGASLPGGILPGTMAAKVFLAKQLLAKSGKGSMSTTCMWGGKGSFFTYTYGVTFVLEQISKGTVLLLHSSPTHADSIWCNKVTL